MIDWLLNQHMVFYKEHEFLVLSLTCNCWVFLILKQLLERKWPIWIFSKTCSPDSPRPQGLQPKPSWYLPVCSYNPLNSKWNVVLCRGDLPTNQSQRFFLPRPDMQKKQKPQNISICKSIEILLTANSLKNMVKLTE